MKSSVKSSTFCYLPVNIIERISVIHFARISIDMFIPSVFLAHTVEELYLFIYLLFYVTCNNQGHIVTGSLQVEETSAYCTVNHWTLARNYQLSNMKCPARDSNQRPQRLKERTLTATPKT